MSEFPWEKREPAAPLAEPAMAVDLRRCTGCHACSVACKVEHGVPLGEFRMRVRWMENPQTGQMAFLPVFDADTCDYGEARRGHGMAPACVAACPTQALRLVEAADAPAGSRPLREPAETKPGVRYVGHADWQEKKLNRGAALDPKDEDPIYEQGYRR